MAHFVELDSDNIVLRVIAVHNNELLVNGVEVEQVGIDFCQNLFGGTWKQTSYNGNIRKQYAGMGYKYDAVADVFISPQPLPSWSLNSVHDWWAPIPKPTDGKKYWWDEATLAWVEAVL